MQLEFITNAAVLVHLSSGKTLLCDPWLGGSAFYGSWYNFPPLDEASQRRYLGLQPDYLYISHSHPDHCHLPTLSHLPKRTPVLLGRLPHRHLARALAEAGFQDLRELPLDETVALEGFELTILSEFAGSGDGYLDHTGYVMDTSLHVRDRDGTTLLHGVDNAIKPADAQRLRERFGRPDVALLPYAGASFFPHGFFAYSSEDKARQRDAVKARRLDAFCAIAAILEPRFCVPAAGSYVMGGRIAGYSEYLHQATPDEIEARWRELGPPASALRLLATGDRLDARTGATECNERAPYRRFTAAERAAHALTLAERPLPQDGVAVPEDFALPWPRLLAKARANQWQMQERLGLRPPVDIELQIRPGAQVAVSGASAAAPFVFRFALDAPTLEPISALPRGGRMLVQFRIDASLLLMLLVHGAIWNNVEVAALVECARQPDIHDPTVHSLMSYFAL